MFICKLVLEEKILALEEAKLLLRNENTELRRLLQEALDKLNKNSTNSSKPPSTDIVRTKSLQISTGKKAGGQKGHTGTTLQISETPDKGLNYKESLCSLFYLCLYMFQNLLLFQKLCSAK